MNINQSSASISPTSTLPNMSNETNEHLFTLLSELKQQQQQLLALVGRTSPDQQLNNVDVVNKSSPSTSTTGISHNQQQQQPIITHSNMHNKFQIIYLTNTITCILNNIQ
eukprot:UN08121